MYYISSPVLRIQICIQFVPFIRIYKDSKTEIYYGRKSFQRKNFRDIVR